jgi:hypothetical protein
MSILQNAIESIQIGVEDFEHIDPRRGVSALRNITAGTLLLFKEKLCRLSPEHDPELLIKRDIAPARDSSGSLVFIGKGKKTVDVFQIQERFKSMDVTVDWKRLEEITNLRNDLEHYYATKAPDAVREVVAKSFLLIRDFVLSELEEDPQALFGNDCWDALLKTSEVYAAEELACKASIEKVDWRYSTVEKALKFLRCPACISALVFAFEDQEPYPDIELKCQSCGNEFCFDDVVEECIDELLSVDSYTRMKEGQDVSYVDCPSCGKFTFILDEQCCVACETELDYKTCSVCEDTLSISDQCNNGMCGYCNYKFEKLRSE